MTSFTKAYADALVLDVPLGDIMTVNVNIVVYRDLAQLAVESPLVFRFPDLINLFFPLLVGVELQVG